MMQEKKTPTSIAVIGAGYWGKNLVRNFDQLGVLRLICENNETIIDKIKNQYENVEFCLAFNEVLQRKDINAVAIATPAETHFRLAQEVLLSGKHVFIEKPMAILEEEARELIANADQNHLTLMVGHLLQYHPVFAYLKKITASGELGRINYIYSHRLNFGKIRREENILWSFAPHDISMILSIAGEEPESVFCTGGNFLHNKIADVTTTHIEFPSGLQAHIFVSWLHPFKEQKLVLVGDRKMAVFDDTQPWSDKLILYPHTINWQNNIPVPDKGMAEKVNISRDEPLRLECQHFLDCISKGNQPLTDGKEGLKVLKILNASQKSLMNNCCKVFVDELERHGECVGRNRNQLMNSRYKKSDVPSVFVHSSAVIDKNVVLGEKTKVWHFSHILSDSKIGKQCNIGQNVVIGPSVTIGDFCKIQNNVSVYKGVTLEDGVFCGPSMVFTNIYNPRAEIRKMDQVRPTLVKKGATIGANATIICGVTLGRYSFVGAGSIVTRNVKDYSLVTGNPAKQIGWVCECGEKLSDNLECFDCGKCYETISSGLAKIS